jgi:6-phosphogluconolactonase
VDQNATGGAISGYSIDATTGALTALVGSPFATGSNPYWIAFTPDGKFAYVSNSGDNTISAYSVAAGVLTALPTPAPADGGPEDLTIDSAGAHLYAPVSSGASPGAVDVFTINADGTLTKVTGSPYPVGIGPRFVNIDPSGRFAYVSSAGTGGTGVYGFSINATTGALTALANSPYDTGANSWPQFITIDPSGKFGYTANQNTGTISEFTIDQTTGVLTAIAGSPLATGAKPFFVSVSPEAPGIRD